MKTAELIQKLEEYIQTLDIKLQSAHIRLIRRTIKRLSEYASQNTLDRDKVREIVKEIDNLAYMGTTVDIDIYTDAICSLAIPSVSEEEIRQMWYFHAYVGKDGEYMTEENFNTTIKELLIPKK